ncbi:MAG: acetylglutamate kinase [Sphingobacteriaceae bacterium]|nr:acetylglutamate kinase [Sphingobacteriaceae bacterium]
MKKLTIVKIGGNVIDHPENLSSFLKKFHELSGLKILVHGGGKVASEIGESLGIKPNMIEGRRVTDKKTLNLVCMVYAGLINKNIVAQLQAINHNAIGLTGADGNIIQASKRLPVTLNEQLIDYGFVGDLSPDSVDIDRLAVLLNIDLTPVFSAITHNNHGQLLNTNADTIASTLAVALSAIYETKLVYCFEKKGVLTDVNDENTLIETIESSEFESLKNSGVIFEGMIPKLQNAFSAIKSGVKAVYIGKAEELQNLEKDHFGTKLIA